MDPITIAMGLAQFVPQLVKWISGSDKAEAVATKAIDIARQVTGAETGDAALRALQASPDLVVQYRKAVLDQELEFQRLAVAAAAAVNTTMQAEAAAEHWPTYSWRPAIGFAVAANVAITSLVVGLAFAGVILFNRPADQLAHIPAMIGAMAALIGVVVPILGIASWFRGKMQADPTTPTDNRG